MIDDNGAYTRIIDALTQENAELKASIAQVEAANVELTKRVIAKKGSAITQKRHSHKWRILAARYKRTACPDCASVYAQCDEGDFTGMEFKHIAVAMRTYANEIPNQDGTKKAIREFAERLEQLL